MVINIPVSSIRSTIHISTLKTFITCICSLNAQRSYNELLCKQISDRFNDFLLHFKC